jgi:hypothetical protein
MEKPTPHAKSPYRQLLAEGMAIDQINQKLGLSEVKPCPDCPPGTRRVSLEKLELQEIATAFQEDSTQALINSTVSN